MKIVRPEKKPMSAILIKQVVSFCLGMCVLTLFLYGIGTAQEFMDKTQLILLRLTSILGLFLGAGSLYGILVNCRLLFRGKVRYIGGIGVYMMLGLFGMAVAAVSVFLVVVAGGNTA
ncbi:MAG: hypothetical protein LBT13_11010 [Treponema sp.]|jgi:hypothetical protein|nr:hypothetical protein [Treponema sp.]